MDNSPINQFIFEYKYSSTEVTEEEGGFYVTLRMGKGVGRPGEPPLKLSIEAESWEDAKKKVEILSHVFEGTLCDAAGEKHVFPRGMERVEKELPAYVAKILRAKPLPGAMSN